MTKNLSSAAPGPELEEAEAKFKTYIAEYRDRAKKHVSQVNKEVMDNLLPLAFLPDVLSAIFLTFLQMFFYRTIDGTRTLEPGVHSCFGVGEILWSFVAG